MEKVGQVQQFMEPHRQVLNAALEELEKIRNLPAWKRFFLGFRIKKICSSLESSGLVYLECRLQNKACTIAVDLLDRLIDFGDDRLGELSILNQNLRQVQTACEQKAAGEVGKRTLISLMPGPDIVTEGYLSDLFDDAVSQHNGMEAFLRDLTARFFNEHQSLSSIVGKSPDQIEQILNGVCTDVFEPWIGQRNVMTELQRLFPHESRQQKIFRQLVRQSEGRVRSIGEAGKKINWTKFVIAPSTDYALKVQNLIARVDEKQGPWHILVDNNLEAVTLLQFRGNISLASLVNTMKLADNPETWQQMIELAIDPFTAIMPLPNPTCHQVRRSFAKALVTGQLAYNENTGFELVFEDRPISLGKDPHDAEKALRSWWPYVVRIESTFGHQIVVDDRDVVRRIKELKASFTSSQNSDQRFVLIDERAIGELETQLDLLIWPAERLRTARRQGGLSEP